MTVMTRIASFCLLGLGTVLVGCGGGDPQDKDEPSGTFPLEVTAASFPAKQSLAEPVKLAIVVKNRGSHALPDVALTVDSFSTASPQAGLAASQRPVWIVDQGPAGGSTAYVNTWALGALAPGASRTFTWKVTAIQSGRHTVRYRVSPGLSGKSKPAAGSKVSGSFTVNVSGKPAQAHVDPQTGEVVRVR